ncbi:MAG: DUF3526 domain-containing protein [Myxococcota bacterium]
MIKLLIARELLDYSRNGQFRILLVVVLVLTGVASLDGWNRAREAAQARAAAEVNDHHVWVEQGANSPHGAAHFARYAFRPTPALAAFEPGSFDYAGAAVWMEAHYQNPATLRRAEDTLARAPLPALSAGWVLRVVGSLALLVLLFPAVARERESGTIRSIAATGVTGGAFVAGKVTAAVATALVFTVIAVVVSLLPAAFIGVDVIEPPRVVALIAVHAVGLTAFGLLAVAVSAMCRTSGAALVGGAALWLAWIVGVPTIGAQLSTTLHPDINERAFKSSLQLEAQTAFWKGEAKGPAVAAYEETIAKEHGATDFDELGFNREAMELQAHEEFANQVYDRLYGEMSATYQAQDRVLRGATVVSPLLALQRVSAGIAGTDLLAQQAFTAQAEQHRRRIIALLNRDMMLNAGNDGFAYMAGRELWEQTADFQGQPPGLAEVVGRYWVELASLLGWLVLAVAVAVGRTRRAMQVEVLT